MSPLYAPIVGPLCHLVVLNRILARNVRGKYQIIEMLFSTKGVLISNIYKKLLLKLVLQPLFSMVLDRHTLNFLFKMTFARIFYENIGIKAFYTE